MQESISMPKTVSKIALVLSILLIAGSSFAQSISKSEYYRHLMFRESPYAPYKGIYPIDQKEAAKVAHYRFDYDKKGRVVSVAHMLGDKIIGDNGNWDSFIWFAPKVTIEYGENKETHRYFGIMDQQIEAHGKVYTAEYKLKNGKRTQLSFTDQEGKPSQNGWSVHKYTWSVDNNGLIVEKRYGLDEKMVSIRPQFGFYETRLHYDNEGKLMFMYNYGLESKPTNNESGAGIDRIFYDHNGNFQRWHVYDKDKNPVEGNRPMVHIGEHLYDALGNKIGMRGFSKTGAPMAFAWGHSKVVNQYDEFGNQSSVISYGKDGEFLANAKIEYTEDGLNRQWIKFVDEKDQLVNAPQLGGAAALEFHYEKGSRMATGRTRYDNQMKKMEPPKPAAQTGS